MKFWIIENKYIPFGKFEGVVLYPFVFVKHTGDNLYRHELQHCYQIAEKGVLRFYWDYLVNLCKHGYHNHPDEVEAREYETNRLSAEERKWKDTGVIELP